MFTRESILEKLKDETFEVDLGDDREEERQELQLSGIASFGVFPTITTREVEFILTDDGLDRKFTVRNNYTGTPIVMVEGKSYKVKFYIDCDKYIVVNVEEVMNGAAHECDFEESVIEQDFIEQCAAKNGSNVVFARDAEGKFLGMDDTGDTVKFSVLCGRRLCHCVYEKDMNCGLPLELPEPGEPVSLRFYSVCGKNYVRANVGDDARPGFLAKIAKNIQKRKIEEARIPNWQKAKYIALLDEKNVYPLVDNREYETDEKSERALLRKYEFLRCLYPPIIQKAINNIINRNGIKSSHRVEALELLINTEWNRELTINDDAEYLKRELDLRFCGQEAYKREIIKMISSFKYRKDKKGGAILIVGVPGIGKTSMFRYAAQIAGIPFEKIPLNSIGNGEYLTGTPLLYSNAMAGKIMSTIRKIGNRAIILLDEVDKMEQNNGADPKTALYELLDGNEKFRDSFIDEDIDISDIRFVLTANDISSIPVPILDRVTVVRIDDYTDEEKARIAKEYVLPQELQKYDLGEKTIEWEDEVFSEIATRYTMSSGVRDIERNIESIVRTAAWKLRSEKLGSIRIGVDSLPGFLGILPCKREKIEHSYSGLRNKFSYFKPEYDPQVRAAAERLFAEYETASPDSREYIRKSLFCLVNILPSAKQSYDLDKVRRSLDASHYGMESLKDEIITLLASEESREVCAPRCILLDGPSGVGKSSICESIAKATGRKFIKIALNGVSNATFIKGSERQYQNSEFGAIVSSIAKEGTDDVLVLLDEIEKMTVTQNGDPYAALIDLLDDSGYFTDSFLNVPINVSNILFMATSNDASRIPSVLLNRMSVMNVPSYTAREKLHIAKSYILPKKLSEYGLSSVDANLGEIMDTVVDKYCKGFGLRDVTRATDKLVRETVRKKKLGEELTLADGETLSKLLGSEPHERGNVASAERYHAGIARALAVSGNAGTTFAVQVTENRFSKEDEITGLPKASTLDSIKIAKMLVSNMLGRHLPTLHFHFGEGGIEKDGPSAGITIFSALYSCMTGIKVPRDIGFTGEIDIFGDVWAIGGTELKIHAAESAGCRRVFIPKQNYEALLKEDKLSRFECEIIPVTNVSELVCELFEGRDAKK